MRFILIDLAAVLFTLGSGALGWAYIKHRKKNSLQGHLKEMRKLGERNAEQLTVDGELTCFVCGEACNPDEDLFLKGAWGHRRCYDNLTV